MANKVHVRKGDLVQVISGKSKGVVGKVLEVLPKENRVRVEGANMITKHQKPTQAMQQGGIITKEGKMDASNVLLYCDTCKKGVRAATKVNEDGTKVRVCKHCGKELD